MTRRMLDVDGVIVLCQYSTAKQRWQRRATRSATNADNCWHTTSGVQRILRNNSDQCKCSLFIARQLPQVPECVLGTVSSILTALLRSLQFVRQLYGLRFSSIHFGLVWHIMHLCNTISTALLHQPCTSPTCLTCGCMSPPPTSVFA